MTMMKFISPTVILSHTVTVKSISQGFAIIKTKKGSEEPLFAEQLQEMTVIW